MVVSVRQEVQGVFRKQCCGLLGGQRYKGIGRLSRLVLAPRALTAIARSLVFVRRLVTRQWEHEECTVAVGWAGWVQDSAQVGHLVGLLLTCPGEGIRTWGQDLQ